MRSNTGAGMRQRLVMALSAALFVGAGVPATADETDARNLLQAMSDYMSGQDALAVDFDAMREVVSTEGQKLAVASSGSLTLARPDRLHATVSDGFESLEMVYDGASFSVAAEAAAVYASVAIDGQIDTLIDALRNTYGRPLPAADLLGADPFAALMSEVIDVKDLGSGMVAGAECDHLAFRTEQVDWQIWIAQGEAPLPCRLLITSKTVEMAPNYIVDFSNWRTGAAVAADDFAFVAPQGASAVEFAGFADAVTDLPQIYSIGDSQ